MTLTMDSLCPHISQSKTRVLKSDMKTSYGITFQELKKCPKTKKVSLFWLLFWVRRFGSLKRPPRRPKVAQEGPKALPRGSLDPPGTTKRGRPTLGSPQDGLQGDPLGPQGAQETPQTPPEAVWEPCWDPLGSIWGCIWTQKRASRPKKEK